MGMASSREAPWGGPSIIGGLLVGIATTLIGMAVPIESLSATLLLPGSGLTSLFWPEGVHTDATLGSALSLYVGLLANVLLVGLVAALVILAYGRSRARGQGVSR